MSDAVNNRLPTGKFKLILGLLAGGLIAIGLTFQILGTGENNHNGTYKLREVADNSIDPKAFAFGRFAKVNGILEVSCLWGLAYPDLPAEDCYIASYTKGECKSNYLQIQEG